MYVCMYVCMYLCIDTYYKVCVTLLSWHARNGTKEGSMPDEAGLVPRQPNPPQGLRAVWRSSQAHDAYAYSGTK